MSDDELYRLRKLSTKLNTLIRQNSQLNERLDDVGSEITEAMERIHATPPNGAPSDRAAAVRKRDQMQREAERQVRAASGASEMKWLPLSGGACKVVIDDGHVMKVSRRLAELLRVLTHAEGESPDEFVPWKSRLAVRFALSEESGKAISEGALAQLLCRLRQILDGHETLHRDFLLTDAKLGLRFALKKSRTAA